MDAGRPKLSVVIGAHNASANIEDCLRALMRERPPSRVEIVVADNSIDGTGEIVRRRFPEVRLVALPPAALVPELWAAGIDQSRGEIVAITTAQCVPDGGWADRVVRAHEADVAAVGGAVENDEAAGIVEWAIYFCRYSRYMLPFQAGLAVELAGDNASYKRACIDSCRHAWRDGFWEPTVHAELRRAGLALRLDPTIVVHHKGGFTLGGFLGQRFRHGRQFGRARARRLSGTRRLLYALASPAIPLLLLTRIARHVVVKRRHVGAFLACLPILALFLLGWSCGELAGYLDGPSE